MLTRLNRVSPALSAGWFLPQERFLRMLALERKRTERSRNCFVLMLLKSDELGTSAGFFEKVLESLDSSTRETDIKGWHEARSVIGVVFTEIGSSAGGFAVDALSPRVLKALSHALSADQMRRLRISFHLYPEDWEDGGSGGGLDPCLYPDLQADRDQKRKAHLVKRSMDIAGSLAALIFLSPALVMIAVFIKLTSRGPVLFRQARIGQYGRKFTFLKFRSMRSTGDHAIHEEYVKSFISGSKELEPATSGKQVVYKMTNDPRVTPLGRFLRKTSLDELPQFLNVLRGEMSLVGPRPPIPYEFACYKLWHRRRLLAVKPGITGLWQVEGRSRVKFEDMVRLDLTYANSWSPWMDLKILLRTPGAVVSGIGAY